MFDKLRGFFAERGDETQIEEDSPEQRIALAAAMLLLEVAWADHELELRELTLIRQSLTTLYKVEAAQVDTIIEQARVDHRQIVGIHEFTRALNDRLSYIERRLLLEHLWRLNAFDGSEFHYEESVIRKVADLLYLRHDDFIRAKQSART